MLARRIIPCLDIANGCVVKGVRFGNLVEVGEPAAIARGYYEDGADEIAVLDIKASLQRRGPDWCVVGEVAQAVFVPVLAGGGVRGIGDFEKLLSAGADKVSVNTAALRRPQLINEAAQRFGSQCVVLAVDARRCGNDWEVLAVGGTQPTGRRLLEWVREAGDRGAGEILLTSWDKDGTRSGYDYEMLAAVVDVARVPVIASGGAGSLQHIRDAFVKGRADAALIASLLHFKLITVRTIKDFLARECPDLPLRSVPQSAFLEE